MYRVRARVFSRMVTRAVKDVPSSSVLDVGSGSGFYIEQWRRLGATRILGVDLTDAAVSNLRKQFPEIRFMQLDIAGPIEGLLPDSFDVVSAFDILYHITDDAAYDRALLNISMMLRPGGYFLFSENFLRGATLRTATQVSRSLGQIASSLAASGLEVITRRPMFVLMNFPIDTRSGSLKGIWRIFARIIGSHEFVGFVLGASLWPFEVLLVTLLAEGPSTEIMLCRKSSRK
jgi:SAM-dependent methyltransferase